MTKAFEMQGLVPAVFSPMKASGAVDLNPIAPVTEQLIQEGVKGLYICGSTGEGPCLSREERMEITKAYISAVSGRIPTVVQVGHQSIPEAQRLAEHAAANGADAISAIPPNYFKPSSLDVIIEMMAEIASAAPDVPFYYYNIPSVTGVQVDLLRFLEEGAEKIPNLVGAKYSHSTVYELQACLEAQGGRFDLLFGTDEMLLSALVVGVKGAVGSTYNFAAPLYNRIIAAFNSGDLETAKHLQAKAAQMVRVLVAHGGNPAIKAMMALLGVDCGGTRLPQKALSGTQLDALKGDMTAIGFFDWGR
ncbi:MAG: dihydrodipicolinate synthase family protein [Trueperaceae bacterium]|nr:dihydrodipicolinate synthase family protein [Trueperaceae bacterium]